MATINLRDYYPFCNHDIFLDIPDEVATVLLEAERQEEAYRRRMYLHKAQYPLDRNDGFEHDICFVSLSPSEVYERKITAQQLHAAISALPDKQGKRIYAHYVLGISKSEIARAERVLEKNIRKSVSQGLRNLEIFLRNFSE
ncbi:RNA polymerase sigma24 factor [Paenibacillus sp. IHB B 3415]|uniref:RNA polymerase sigma24 factor n=1 Tax=Paenibacillus sp. IHB B 3415 TaxID=867080 RepID=UPI0005741882|nr:RNA polymerase sigma24 factor [Paenibacillus sp. IHB B 3415]KHL91681.1 RNA polymerase sigma24 factor [Paenibacillus sp. IHB B 3415]